VHELIERFDAHLTAEQYFSVIANMKGSSPEDVASRLLKVPGLEGLQVRSPINVRFLNKLTVYLLCSIWLRTSLTAKGTELQDLWFSHVSLL